MAPHSLRSEDTTFTGAFIDINAHPYKIIQKTEGNPAHAKKIIEADNGVDNLLECNEELRQKGYCVFDVEKAFASDEIFNEIYGKDGWDEHTKEKKANSGLYESLVEELNNTTFANGGRTLSHKPTHDLRVFDRFVYIGRPETELHRVECPYQPHLQAWFPLHLNEHLYLESNTNPGIDDAVMSGRKKAVIFYADYGDVHPAKNLSCRHAGFVDSSTSNKKIGRSGTPIGALVVNFRFQRQ